VLSFGNYNVSTSHIFNDLSQSFTNFYDSISILVVILFHQFFNFHNHDNSIIIKEKTFAFPVSIKFDHQLSRDLSDSNISTDKDIFKYLSQITIVIQQNMF